jgi:hypothetical protein
LSGLICLKSLAEPDDFKIKKPGTGTRRALRGLK